MATFKLGQIDITTLNIRDDYVTLETIYKQVYREAEMLVHSALDLYLRAYSLCTVSPGCHRVLWWPSAPRVQPSPQLVHS